MPHEFTTQIRDQVGYRTDKQAEAARARAEIALNGAGFSAQLRIERISDIQIDLHIVIANAQIVTQQEIRAILDQADCPTEYLDVVLPPEAEEFSSLAYADRLGGAPGCIGLPPLDQDARSDYDDPLSSGRVPVKGVTVA